MRKIWMALLVSSLILLGLGMIAWLARANLAAAIFSRHLHVPVSIQTLDLDGEGAYFTKIWVGNPPRSRTKTSFSAESLDIETTWKKLRSDPLLIEEIAIRNIFIGIENYDPAGTETNWSYILQSNGKKSDRDYLIKTLVLENLTVELTSSDGKTKRFPTIPRLELHNISSQTGFPVGEIEKAIFKLIMQDLLDKLNIKQIIQGIQNAPGVPPVLKYLPSPF